MGRGRCALQRGALDGATRPRVRSRPIAHRSLYRRDFRRRYPHQRGFCALRPLRIHRTRRSCRTGTLGQRGLHRAFARRSYGAQQGILRYGRRVEAGSRFRVAPAGSSGRGWRGQGGRKGVHSPANRRVDSTRSGPYPRPAAQFQRQHHPRARRATRPPRHRQRGHLQFGNGLQPGQHRPRGPRAGRVLSDDAGAVRLLGH